MWHFTLIDVAYSRHLMKYVTFQFCARLEQIPSYLFARKEFSAASTNNASRESGAPGDPSGSGSNMSKAVIGSLALGFAGIAAYQTGYLDSFFANEQHSTHGEKTGSPDQHLQVSTEHDQKSEAAEYLKGKIPADDLQDPNLTSVSVEPDLKNSETISDTTDVNTLSKSEDDSNMQAAVLPGSTQTDASPDLDHELASTAQSSEATDRGSTNNVTQVEKNHHLKSPEVNSIEQHEPVDTAVEVTHANKVPKEDELNAPLQQTHITALEVHFIKSRNYVASFLFTSM